MSLESLQPDEILLNEGHKNSVLAQKIFTYYSRKHAVEVSSPKAGEPGDEPGEHSLGSVSATGAAPLPTTTVVKFISRGNFDQTKGAELLAKVARPSSYKPEVSTSES